MRGLLLLAAAAVLLVGCRETVHESTFVVSAGGFYEFSVEVYAPTSMAASWSTVNRNASPAGSVPGVDSGTVEARDGSAGDVDVSLSGPGLERSWPRSDTTSFTADVIPGVYTFRFVNDFSVVTSKEVSLRITLTPR